MSTPIGISGSRSAAVLGLSPYKTKIQIWLEMKEILNPGFCEKNGYTFEPFEGNNQTDWGSAFEDSICAVVERTKGSPIENREEYFVEDYITCHIDGLIKTDGEVWLIENKTTSAPYFYDNFSEKLNRIPISYMCQVQHNLFLTGLKKCMMNVLVFPKRVDEFVADGWIIEYHDGEYFLNADEYNVRTPEMWTSILSDMGYLKTFTIERDDSLTSMMLEHYSTFWNENIIGGIMPDPQNLDDIKSIYTAPKGTVIATEQIERWMSEKKQLISEKKDIDKRIDQIKLLAMDYLREQDGCIDDDTRDKTFLMSRDGRKLATYNRKVIR